MGCLSFISRCVFHRAKNSTDALDRLAALKGAGVATASSDGASWKSTDDGSHGKGQKGEDTSEHCMLGKV